MPLFWCVTAHEVNSEENEGLVAMLVRYLLFVGMTLVALLIAVLLVSVWIWPFFADVGAGGSMGLLAVGLVASMALATFAALAAATMIDSNQKRDVFT